MEKEVKLIFCPYIKERTLLPESKYLPKTMFKSDERKLAMVQFQSIIADEYYTRKKAERYNFS